MPTNAPPTSSSREKVNKCHKKTYKEALTGRVSHISQTTANLDESEFPSFIPSGIEEKKIEWPSSKVTNQDEKSQHKLEPEKGAEKRIGASSGASSGANGARRPAWPGCGQARSPQRARGTARARFASSVWRPRRGSSWRGGGGGSSWSRERKPEGSRGASKVESLLYLPSCSQPSKDATVHFFPEKFQIPRYSFDMVYYEKLGLYLRGKTFKLNDDLSQDHRLLV